jgi:hypothetical protein
MMLCVCVWYVLVLSVALWFYGVPAAAEREVSQGAPEARCYVCV